MHDHGVRDVPVWRRYVGLVALMLAAVSVVTFLAFMSFSVRLSKALVYGGDPIAALYLNAPTISAVTGAASVVIAIVAMWGSRQAMITAIAGLGISVPVFAGFMFIAFGVISKVAPQADQGLEALPAAYSMTFMASPPAIGLAGALLATGLVLWRLRSTKGHRPAIAASIAGGMVTAYWIFDVLVMSASSE